jgi:hypothetical protein
MRSVLVAGPAVLTSGGLVIAVSFLASQSQRVRFDAAIAGFVLVAGGAIFTMIGMQRILRDETYVALRTDGIALRVAGQETLVGWDELAEARWDAARGEIVLERTDGSLLAVAHRFARATGPELCARIAQTKRRAAMNMLG